MIRFFSFMILGFCSFFPESHAWVDLHAHWFIQDEVPGKLFGSFHGPIQAKSWKPIFASRVNKDAIQESGVTIAVVSLYASPFYFRSYRDSIRRQLKETNEFLDHNSSEWVLARNSAEALNIRQAGKKALVLSLEGASGILETDADFSEFLDQAGISIVTLQHFVDDDLGGAAVMHSFYRLLNGIGWLRDLGFWPGDRGLTSKGSNLLQKMIEKKIWVDAAHASRAVFKQIADRYEAEGLPILVTHTVHEEWNASERALNTEEFQRVIQSGGIAGLIPSDSMFSVRAGDPKSTFQSQWGKMSSLLNQSIGIGTDINAPIRTLPDYTHLGDFKNLTRDLNGFSSESSESAFLKAWSRVR